MTPTVSQIINDPIAFLKFMRDNRYPIVHESNVFYRDVEYAIAKYQEAKTGKKTSYFTQIENDAKQVCAAFVSAGMFKQVSAQAYNLNCKEFMLPRPEPAPAKPAAPAASAAAEPAVA